MNQTDKATRSRIMASVKSKNTKLEMRVRSAAHKLGFRFRLHRKELPGSPDLIFPRLRVAMFVHGCFWHGHDCPHGRRMPVTNVDYWCNKIKRNVERDAKVQAELINMGWKPIVIWECEIKKADLPKLIKQLLCDG